MSQTPPSNSLPPKRDASSPDSSSDKEQYSLDEMMEALREQDREKEEKGELVTRADGTYARKVKRRRRRSDQPESGESKSSPSVSKKKKKSFLFKVMTGAALLLILLLTSFYLIFSKNTKSYQNELEETAAEWTGAEVQFNGYQRYPFTALINSAELKWPSSSYAKELQMKKLEGDLTLFSLMGAKPSGLQFGAKTGKLFLQMPTASSKGSESLAEEDFPFGFEQYFCENLDVNFGDLKETFVRGTSAHLNYVSNEGFMLNLDQGFLRLNGWHDLPISTALLGFTDDKIILKSLSLTQPKDDEMNLDSTMKISGEIPLAAGAQAELGLVTEGFSLRGLIGKRLSPLFKGKVLKSTGKVFYTMGEKKFDEVVIDIEAERMVLSGFPFLITLQELFPDENLDDLDFDSGIGESLIKGTFRMRPEGVALEDVAMARKGNFRLKGNVVVGSSVDQEIAGNIELWINRAYFTRRPELANHPLLEGSEQSGYVVVKFKLGGTVKNPKDTFRSEMGLQSGFESGGSSFQDSAENHWEKLTK